MLRGQVALNDRGEILTDEVMRTNLAGVFAAGDSRLKRYRQITTAVADGTIASWGSAPPSTEAGLTGPAPGTRFLAHP
jgi:thioredoxin reductase (NADPH)